MRPGVMPHADPPPVAMRTNKMERARHRMAGPAARPARTGTSHVGVASVTSAHRMPTTDELNQWMRAVATSSDRLAFAALFRHFAPRLMSYLRRCGSPDAQAEELVQETMVILWRRAVTFDPAKAQLSTWLFTVARNVRISHLRRLAAGEAPAASADPCDQWDADLQAADQALGPHDQLLAAQRERGVRRALSVLPADQARVLQLSYFEEQSHARIAEELGIPLGTVKSRIRLAVAQLRRLLDGFDS